MLIQPFVVLIVLLTTPTESEATSSALKDPVKRRRTSLRSTYTTTVVLRHLLLQRRTKMLGNWKGRVSLRSSDDAPFSLTFVMLKQKREEMLACLSNDQNIYHIINTLNIALEMIFVAFWQWYLSGTID